MLKRRLKNLITKYLFNGKILIVYGARQVGKTTLVKDILRDFDSEEGYFNCELLSVKRQLESLKPKSTRSFLGKHKIIVLDEAQKVSNIGLVLKQLIDTYPNLQIIATGSSSFDLSSKISEPLTGRAFEFRLFPLSLTEIAKKSNTSDILENLDSIMTYGLYPEVYLSHDQIAKKLLDSIASQYLFRDILELESLKKPRLLLNLLELIALQIGNEVSTFELATALEVSRKTVERYIDLLEKAFVLFRLRAYSRNPRKEITKKHKIYFYDLGIRNAILSKYTQTGVRDDVGPMWENLLVCERMKHLEYSEVPYKKRFWRSHMREEVDYVEERSGELFGYEFKLGDKKTTIPKEFKELYPKASFKTINRQNFRGFVGL